MDSEESVELNVYCEIFKKFKNLKIFSAKNFLKIEPRELLPDLKNNSIKVLDFDSIHGELLNLFIDYFPNLNKLMCTIFAGVVKLASVQCLCEKLEKFVDFFMIFLCSEQLLKIYLIIKLLKHKKIQKVKQKNLQF